MCNLGKIDTSIIQCKDRQLKKINQEVQQKIDTLLFMHPRKKRGILGDILTTLFGVNDKVYHDIDNLNSNNQRLIQANHQHGKLMLNALRTTNRKNKIICLKLKNFNHYLNSGLKTARQPVHEAVQHGSWPQQDQPTIYQHINTYQRATIFLF